MVLDNRSLHLKLQEYCDCYLETDSKQELEVITKEGLSSDVLGDPEDVAIKFLGLTVLYGIEQKAKRISFLKTSEGEVSFKVEATGK